MKTVGGLMLVAWVISLMLSSTSTEVQARPNVTATIVCKFVNPMTGECDGVLGTATPPANITPQIGCPATMDDPYGLCHKVYLSGLRKGTNKDE